MSETTSGAYVYQQIVKTTAEWAADTTVIVENVWLFERRTDGKIITKLSDGKHCYADLEEYGLGAWDAAQLGGYEGTKEEFYEALGGIDTVVEQLTALVDSLDGKFAETPTLAATPTEDTLTYTVDDATRNFSIGQQCRVYEADEEDYVFYQLYNITSENKADWRVAGGGGASAFQEKVIITLSSNQGTSDSALTGKKVTLSYSGQQTELVWQGEALEVNIPMQVEYVVTPEVADGYSSPAAQTYVAVGGSERQISLVYSTEVVTVNVTAESSGDCSAVAVTVKKTSDDTVIGSGTGAQVVVKVPFGTEYTVSVGTLSGYTTPASQSFTANTAARAVTMTYELIKSSVITIDQTVSDPATMISGDVNGEIIQWIRQNSHRVLAKKTSDGNVTYCRLSDTDSTKYYDGTAAVLTGNEGDVFMKMPDFYYYATEGDAVTLTFAKEKINDNYVKWDGNTLIGVYEAYNSSSKLYSRSGVASTGNVSQANFKTYARARGTGYQLVDWQMHCVMACLFYAQYGHTNSQAKIGVGTNTYDKSTGQTNSLGMTDTTTTNGNSMSINFWGLENWWGNKYEWMDDYDNPANSLAATVNDPVSGSTRQLALPSSSADYGAYVKKMKFGKYLDLIATGDDPKDGTDSTGYCDYQWWPGTTSSSPRVLRRSYSYSYAYGGVAYAVAHSASSYTYSYSGSRLAFRGVSREAESVSAFKALSVL